VAAGLVLVVLSCYPYPNPLISDYDTVVTVRAEGASFEGLNTYAIPDTIFRKPGDMNIKDSLEEFLVDEVHRNMQKIGYQLESDPETNPPDVAVVISVITEDRYGSWVGWGWNGWYGGGGGLWVTYPPASVQYLYTNGSVSLDMVDYANADVEEGVFPVLWAAAINGPLQSNVDNQKQRVSDGINKAFDQSPYLKP
jgi:hypothetical protein